MRHGRGATKASVLQCDQFDVELHQVTTMLRRRINPSIMLVLTLCGATPPAPPPGGIITVSGAAQGDIPAESSQVEIAIAGEPIPGSCPAVPARRYFRAISRIPARADSNLQYRRARARRSASCPRLLTGGVKRLMNELERVDPQTSAMLSTVLETAPCALSGKRHIIEGIVKRILGSEQFDCEFGD